ncbi:MAG: MotA/TolQ/ExbB proton channel family protein [Phycisphaerae bacterium]|nr:MotA/TolQ/ExbB proton channel family protein [Phycisphaerae bacterium]
MQTTGTGAGGRRQIDGRRGLVVLATVVLCLGCPGFEPLARADSHGADPPPVTGAGSDLSGGLEMGQGIPTIAELFQTSLYINTALLVLSVLALVIFLYLIMSLSRSMFTPARFVDDVTKLVVNRQFDQAIHLCQSNDQVFISSMIQRVIENREKDHGVLIDILLAEGRRRSELVWNRIGYIGEIANMAPMLGLLGTVIGMIKVFFTLTTRTIGESAGDLSAGIAEAMGTTMFGLIVAIAAGVFYTLARGRATGVLAEAEQVCHTVADHAHAAAADPRMKKIEAIADAARHRVSQSRPDSGGPRGPNRPTSR